MAILPQPENESYYELSAWEMLHPFSHISGLMLDWIDNLQPYARLEQAMQQRQLKQACLDWGM